MTMTDEQPAEVVEGEVLDGPSTELERVDQTNALAAAVTDDMGFPGRDEMMGLAQMALMFSQSDLAPKDLRGKPYNAFLVLMSGRDLGVTPTAALRKIYVVDGQPSIAPQLGAALVRQKGLGRVQRGHVDAESAEAIPLGPDGSQMGPAVVFTWEMAQVAGLVRPDCTATEHSDACKTAARSSDYNKRKAACKTNWCTYPERMLWWRAVGYCVDDYFPEVSMGLYSPDELGALVDEEGAPLDPATADLPDGYKAPQGHPARSQAQPPSPDSVEGSIDDAVAEELTIVIGSLADDEELRDRVMDAWKTTLGLKITRLSRQQQAKALALVRGMVPDYDERAARGKPADDNDDDGEGDEQTGDEQSDSDDEVTDAEVVETPPITATAPWIREIVADAPADEVARVSGVVKALHHRIVNRMLNERYGHDPTVLEGMHIDQRRMLLTGHFLESGDDVDEPSEGNDGDD